MDIVQVVCVILVHPNEFSRVVISEYKLARATSRVCMGTLKDRLDRWVFRLPRQDVDVLQPFEAMCVVVDEGMHQPRIERAGVLDVEVFAFHLHRHVRYQQSDLKRARMEDKNYARLHGTIETFHIHDSRAALRFSRSREDPTTVSRACWFVKLILGRGSSVQAQCIKIDTLSHNEISIVYTVSVSSEIMLNGDNCFLKQ